MDWYMTGGYRITKWNLLPTEDATFMTSTAADPWLLNRQHAAAMAEAARQKRVCDEAEEATRQLKRSKKPAVKSAEAKEAMLAQYPSVPLSEYAPNGDHLAINIDYPGLRAVHKNPWIFLVPDYDFVGCNWNFNFQRNGL